MCKYKSKITYLSSDPVQSPFANLEPPRKTFTHRFRDEDISFLFKADTGIAGCSKIGCNKLCLVNLKESLVL